MKKENAGSFEFDVRSLKSIWIMVLVWAFSLYFANTEFFNEWISANVSKEMATTIIMVLVYVW